MKGKPWTIELEDAATRISKLYCLRCRERWGIEMTPVVGWDDDRGLLTIGAEPAGPLDEAMLCAQMIKEGLPPC